MTRNIYISVTNSGVINGKILRAPGVFFKRGRKKLWIGKNCMKEYLEAGRIVNTHGVRGDLKAECWCDSEKVLAGLKQIFVQDREGAFQRMAVERGAPFKNMVLLKLEGVDDIDAGLRFKNRVIYALRADLPLAEGSCFLADLIGLPVIDADSGAVYGRVSDVPEIGGRQLYEVENERGKFLVPAVKEFICRVDPESGVYIRPIAGMLE